MVKLLKHDWNAIVKDLENGMSRVAVARKYQLIKGVLSSKISKDYPHLLVRVSKDTQVKIKPLKALNIQCPIVRKIEIMKLLNKKIPSHQIATQLKIDILEVEKIIHKIKSGEK